jgi:hypothetical protein
MVNVEPSEATSFDLKRSPASPLSVTFEAEVKIRLGFVAERLTVLYDLPFLSFAPANVTENESDGVPRMVVPWFS